MKTPVSAIASAVFVGILLLNQTVATAQTSSNSCPPGTEDMVAWMLPSDMGQHLQGSNLKLYASAVPGKMYFVKSKNGFPLDEKLVYGNYIRDYITENGQQDGWTNPKNVKQYVGYGVKLAPRCIPIGSPGQRLASVKNDKSTTEFVSKVNCTVVSRHNAGYVIGQVWNQGWVDFGGSVGNADTRVLTYRWGCDSTYSNCSTREELWLARGFGWVEWKNYKLQNGVYVLINDTKADEVMPGNVAPNQPCGDAPVN